MSFPDPIPGFAPHFSRRELERSSTAIAANLENVTPDDLLPNLKKVSWKLEQARDVLGGYPLSVTSGYRSPAVNALAVRGSSTTGVHPLGLAGDILPPNGMSLKDAFGKLQGSKDFMEDIDQLIIECGCIHVGLPYIGRLPRHELRADKWVGPNRTYPLIGIWKEDTVQLPGSAV